MDFLAWRGRTALRQPGAHVMDSVVERAAHWGLETEYRDAFGQQRSVDPQVLAKLLDSLAARGVMPERILPRTLVVRGETSRTIHLAAAEGMPVRWEIRSEQDAIAQGEATSPWLQLPEGLPGGVFSLHVAVSAGKSPQTATASLVVCPRAAYQGPATAPHRMWVLAVQLYGVRSRGNWGHGDFTDLLALIDLAADLGAAGIGLNPLHALFDDRPRESSPYFPSSRLFLNPFYIDLEAVPEFPGRRAAGLDAEIERLRSVDHVDYAGIAKLKMHALRTAYELFCRQGAAPRRASFERFRQQRGSTLERYACFEVLRRKFPGPWWEWPDEWRTGSETVIASARRTEAVDMGFVEFVQWLAHEQLELCRARARAHGLPIGLYLDIAVGVRSDGFDAWCDQDAILTGTAVGAPPDALNTAGQNWGLAGFNPVGLEDRRFAPFQRVLEASMAYAGAIRLDHVLGLKRLYLIPHGMKPAEGAYIRCPFEPLLAIVALASVQHGCIVIGEDLGTVPENFRETLADWGIWSYQVMMFERAPDGAFSAPAAYRQNALVSFGTHDLPTFAGWQQHRDLALKRALAIDPGETSDQRASALCALQRALQQHGMHTCDFAAVAKFLADTASRLLVISLEDLLGLTDQVNVPGTMDEHPNWRQRLPVAIEEMKERELVAHVADMMRAASRSAARSTARDDQSL
jgi:4-alpha-glucanotransferase